MTNTVRDKIEAMKERILKEKEQKLKELETESIIRESIFNKTGIEPNFVSVHKDIIHINLNGWNNEKYIIDNKQQVLDIIKAYEPKTISKYSNSCSYYGYSGEKNKEKYTETKYDGCFMYHLENYKSCKQDLKLRWFTEIEGYNVGFQVEGLPTNKIFSDIKRIKGHNSRVIGNKFYFPYQLDVDTRWAGVDIGYGDLTLTTSYYMDIEQFLSLINL